MSSGGIGSACTEPPALRPNDEPRFRQRPPRTSGGAFTGHVHVAVAEPPRDELQLLRLVDTGLPRTVLAAVGQSPRLRWCSSQM
jgi:hypothetical protein